MLFRVRKTSLTLREERSRQVPRAPVGAQILQRFEIPACRRQRARAGVPLAPSLAQPLEILDFAIHSRVRGRKIVHRATVSVQPARHVRVFVPHGSRERCRFVREAVRV